MIAVISESRGIDGLAFGPDGSIYFTDATRLRRLLLDGTVTTIAESMTEPSWGEDLMGLVVESATSIYVADYSGIASCTWMVPSQELTTPQVNRILGGPKIGRSRFRWQGETPDDRAERRRPRIELDDFPRHPGKQALLRERGRRNRKKLKNADDGDRPRRFGRPHGRACRV